MQRGTFFFFVALLFFSCEKSPLETPVDYRQEMREFVIRIAEHTHAQNPDFFVIPHNAEDLLTLDGVPTGPIAPTFANAISGMGRDALYYGLHQLNIPTPQMETEKYTAFLRRLQELDKPVFVTDYCNLPALTDQAFQRNQEAGFIPFNATSHSFHEIPDYPAQVFGENGQDIEQPEEAANFLKLINSERYQTKKPFLNDLSRTNYDLLVLDLFFQDGTSFSYEELELLQEKANGGRRLLLCYLPIGEANALRYYWQPEWSEMPPDWLEASNPSWQGHYKVEYWNEGWQSVIIDSYLDLIIEAGFDGVYLDLADAHQYFEE